MRTDCVTADKWPCNTAKKYKLTKNQSECKEYSIKTNHISECKEYSKNSQKSQSHKTTCELIDQSMYIYLQIDYWE